MDKTRTELTSRNIEDAILFFGKTLPVSKPVSNEAYMKFIQLGLKAGYLVHPACCTIEVSNFLKVQKTNPNSTFWKTWEDVTSRSQEELFLYAAVHYLSTYGTAYSMPAFVPNSDYEDLPFAELKPILPATLTELATECVSLLESGIALNENNVNMAVNFIIDAANQENFKFNIDTIKNREAKIKLCSMLDIIPNDPVDYLRLLVYTITESTLLIKSKQVISLITARMQYPQYYGGNTDNIGFDKLNDVQLAGLASIFYRFKPLFLAFRHNTEWRPVINKIRRLANTHHKPMKIGIFESILDPKHTNADVVAALTKETNFWKLTRLYSYLAEEVYLTNKNEAYTKAYLIRNGKVFTRTFDADTTTQSDRNNSAVIRMALVFNRICELLKNYRIASGMSNVYLPENINLTVPTSEKQFIGEIPYGSYFDMALHNFVGVYWRNEWGTHDYDLSYINMKGTRYGWNSYYAGDGVVFSGDMTNADPEATEMFYCAKEMPDGIFKLNRFNGKEGSRARIFFGQQKIKELSKSYMVNPASIKFKADIFPQDREAIIGGVFDNRAYIFSSESGNTRVSTNSTDLYESMKRKMMMQMPMRTLLEAAGYTILNDTEVTEDTVIDYDFREFTKADLLTFYTNVIKHAENNIAENNTSCS